MGAARLVVSNTTLPRYVEKGRGQTYLQTWHGAPVKRIGKDVPNSRISTESYLRRLLAEADSWDVLVSAGPSSTEVFRRAVGYDGRVLEIGRPSNDLLVGERAGIERKEVRADLGIPEDQTVLLYAPTWREDARTATGWGKVLHLDHQRVTASRPDVTVLLRGHPHTAGQPTVAGGPRVLDVTTYPDITRLYLAADLLVTDYSSAMVDFCLTDRPVVVLAPDLEAYRDHVRGLYVDLEHDAPGPVVRTTGEVLDAMEELDTPRWAARRQAMRRQLAPLDDGKATERLVAAVLGDA
jgi:CDP-glycerol glycerophosphotransferase